MYLLQAYLRNGGTLAELNTSFAINAIRHKTYPNLVLLKYNQIESPFTEPLVREARGIILDETDNWRVVCARFKKFFNYGEVHAAQIDWNTARVQEKCDGSLATLYFYDNKWQMATSGSPDASGEVHGWDFTFAELFWKTFNEMRLTLPLNENFCPSFELTSPWNRVVVPHKEAKLTLIGMFDRETGNEFVDHDTAYPVVKSYPLKTLEDVMVAIDKLDGLNNEGFVVVDADFNRIKLKSPKYVNLHHLKDGFGPRRIAEIVRAGEISEIVVYFPEFAEQFNSTKEKYDKLVLDLLSVYNEIKHFEVQKDFALAVQERKPVVSSALYMLRAGKVDTIAQHLALLPIDTFMRALGLKE